MNRSKIIERMKSKTTTIDQFNYDALSAPPLLSLLTYDDIEYFRRLATSIKYSAKIDFKYKEIDRIMKMRGFVKLGGGTNRVVYRHLEIDTIVVKIAIDAVGIKDNPREYQNQFYLKPYVTKVFEVSPCGTVGLFERCDQITSREEFQSVASEVYDLLSNWIIGKYIMEDIGSEYFMNYCVRPGFGPVLCDFPYLYELDGNKLYCQIPDENGFFCDGLIDYDEGFNHLYCSKCGAKYKAIELKKAIDNKLIISKEKENVRMKIVTRLGDKVMSVKDTTKETRKFESRRDKKYKKIKENDPTDIIRITTSKQKEEEKMVTKMNELPEWDDVARIKELGRLVSEYDDKLYPNQNIEDDETDESLPADVSESECTRIVKDDYRYSEDKFTLYYRDFYGCTKYDLEELQIIAEEAICEIRNKLFRYDNLTFNLRFDTIVAVYGKSVKSLVPDKYKSDENNLIVKSGTYNLTDEEYDGIYKMAQEILCNKIKSEIGKEDLIIQVTIEANKENVNNLDDKCRKDIKDICKETIEYIKEDILNKNNYKDLDIILSIDVLTNCDDIEFKERYTSMKCDETSDSDETKEEQDYEKDTTESEYIPEDEVEIVEEDAYEENQKEEEEIPDYSSTFIPQPKDEDEIPVGATQVNNSYYNNNKKKNKHR